MVERISIPPVMDEIEAITIIPFLVLRGFRVKIPVKIKAIPRIPKFIMRTVPKVNGRPIM
jgi:hypothetical protein